MLEAPSLHCLQIDLWSLAALLSLNFAWVDCALVRFAIEICSCFETKLLWVRELIFSKIAKEEAERRHAFLLQFVDQYALEQNWCTKLK